MVLAGRVGGNPMSLINDLVLEVDRRRGNSRNRPPTTIHHLNPVRRKEKSKERPDYLVAAMAWIAVGCVLIAGFLLNAPETLRATVRLQPTALEESTPTPAVGARATEPTPRAPTPKESSSTAAATLAGVAIPEIEGGAARTPLNRVHRVSTEPLQNGIRLRIEVDRIVDHQLLGRMDRRQIEVILSSTRIEEPVGPLALRDTALQSFQSRAVEDATHFHIALEDVDDVQERWVAAGQRAALLVEFVSEAKRPSTRSSAARSFGDIADNANRAPLPGATRPPAVSASIGPRTLEIAPSAVDVARRKREAQRVAGNRIRERARAARAQGELDRAAILYKEAALKNPWDHRIGIERVETLFEGGRDTEAKRLIRSARQSDPKEPSWAMLQAKSLAAEGDLDAAVAVLDGLETDLRRAPEIHAMAAAYSQRSGQHGDALDRYESLVRQFPSRANLWLGMGISLEALGRSEEAADVYRIAIEVGGLSSSARSWVMTRVDSLQGKG